MAVNSKVAFLIDRFEDDRDKKVVDSWDKQLADAMMRDELWNNPALRQVWETISNEEEALTHKLSEDDTLSEIERKISFRYRDLIRKIIKEFKDANLKVESINKQIDNEYEIQSQIKND